jgi:hypothetical protein
MPRGTDAPSASACDEHDAIGLLLGAALAGPLQDQAALELGNAARVLPYSADYVFLRMG